MKIIRFFYFLFLSVLFLVVRQSPISASDELNQIKLAIRAKNANWIAGENWTTKLSLQEKINLCGALLEPPDPSKAKLMSLPRVESLPTSFDWRNNNGNWVSPVRNQGGCGSCWDFSAVGQVESWWKIKNEQRDAPIDLSEQFVLSCSDGSCDGWGVDSALEFIRKMGIPPENCFPYDADDAIPCSDACADWRDEAVRIPGWGYVSLAEPIINNMKNAIFRHPLSASYTVYEDFNYYNGGVYEHVWGEEVAGHAILIVGWNDAEQSWICKNSWGPYWGSNGYFRIKWGDCNMGAYSPFIWEDVTGHSDFTIAPGQIDLSLKAGESATRNIVISNQSDQRLEFSMIDYEVPQVFHADGYNSFDGSSWWCGDREIGGYDNHWLQYLDTPILDLSNTVRPKLTWMGYWAVEDPASAEFPFDGWDGCNFWLSSDGGLNFQVATPSNPPYDCKSLFSFGDQDQGWDMGSGIGGWAGTSDGWQQVECDLAPYKSGNVIVRFAFASDKGLSTVDDPELTGFFVDQIKVSDGAKVIFEDDAQNQSAMNRSGFGSKQANWMDLSYGNGVLSPSEVLSVEVKFDTKDLAPGVYHGLIQIQTNDTTRSQLEIPCNLEVLTPALDVAVESMSTPSEEIMVLSTFTIQATVKNIGYEDAAHLNVECRILKEEQNIFQDMVSIPSLSAGASESVQFSPHRLLETGEFDVEVRVKDMANEENTQNNLLQGKIKITNLIEGFEAGDGNWTFRDGWGVTDFFGAYTGISSAHVQSGIIPYRNNMNTTMTYHPGLDLRNVDDAMVKYWAKYFTDKDADICYLETSVDNVKWTRMDSVSGVSLAWTQREVSLKDFIDEGHTRVWLRFRFISNENGFNFGVLIDDVEIYPHVSTAVAEIKKTPLLPTSWSLAQNYPNPFNMQTTIRYEVVGHGDVSVAIFNTRGQMVRKLIQAVHVPGEYHIQWDGNDDAGNRVGSGIYFYRMDANGMYQMSMKMVLMK